MVLTDKVAGGQLLVRTNRGRTFRIPGLGTERERKEGGDTTYLEKVKEKVHA